MPSAPTLLLALATTLFLGLASADALAWGKTGHRVTGAIAEHYLSPEARAAVTAILGSEDLARASTWADEMRSNPSEYWQRTANPWHYVTVPAGKAYADVGAPPQGDAVSALLAFRDTLRDADAPLAERQRALRFTVHIVGDLHQPLHAGNGTDRGGNDVKVEFYGRPTNLHAVWDSGLVDGEQLSYTEWTTWLMRRIGPEQLAAWASADPNTWIAESTALRDQAYPTADEGDRLSWDYTYRSIPVVRERLAMGGVRIAAWLNAVFAD